jgi:hypothetical protein
MRSTFSDGGVDIEIIAGMAQRPPLSNDPDPGKRKSSDVSGWYVICNGRVVLAADRSDITCWGSNNVPIWHYQYSGFVGIVSFSSKDSTLLPMTTTKRSVDVSSSVYLRTRLQMIPPTRRWIDYTNYRKDNSEVRALEGETRPFNVWDVKTRAEVNFPTAKGSPVERKVNIHFPVLKKDVTRLGEAFGNEKMPAREVGLRSFNFALEHKAVDFEDGE